ncbi:MAG: NAD-binding protein [Candidatus Lokiarchaeota archaeon]|nr:NAD-binding protein [Candidatus Lokiarchaeota archaeon]
MSIISFFIDIELKLKQYKALFLFLFLVWLGGFTYYAFHYPVCDVWAILLYSLAIRTPPYQSDFSSFYTLAWPILLEVIVFGFIAGELLEKYNPVITSKIIAKHKRNHTLIIGYSHLAERVIEYCVKNKKSFALIEDRQESVEDLINGGHPVVIGDPTQVVNLELASVSKANEVFILLSDVRVAVICAEKIRKYNPECPLYVRVHEEHVQEYLKQPHIRAFPFSTSQWSMNDVEEWIEGKKGNVIVIGRDMLTHRIAYRISQQEGREIYLFDDVNDGIEFEVNQRLHLINECACYLSDIEPHVDLRKVSQVFISWKKGTQFDEALYLTSVFRRFYPEIEIFVRIFDDELVEIVKKYGAKTFSSSYRAFKLLQRVVNKDSSIAL